MSEPIDIKVKDYKVKVWRSKSESPSPESRRNFYEFLNSSSSDCMSPNSELFISRLQARNADDEGMDVLRRPPPVDPKNPPSSLEKREANRAGMCPYAYQRMMNEKFLKAELKRMRGSAERVAAVAVNNEVSKKEEEVKAEKEAEEEEGEEEVEEEMSAEEFEELTEADSQAWEQDWKDIRYLHGYTD
jgi:hypothetical protein